MAEYGSAFKKTKMGMVKNEVARGADGAKLQRGNRASPELASKGVGKGKTAKSTMVKNAVAAGAAPRGPEANRSKIWNGSTDRGEPQTSILKAKGGVGTPNKEWVDMGVGKMTQKSGMVVHKVK